MRHFKKVASRRRGTTCRAPTVANVPRRDKACAQNRAPKRDNPSCNSFATGNNSVHARIHPGQDCKFLRLHTSPDGRICIYMILAMTELRCHLANRSLPDRLVLVMGRIAILAIAGWLAVASGFAQSSASPSSPVAVSAQDGNPAAAAP